MMRRVLVVDDNEDIRALLRYVLSTRGIDTDEAAGGAEAIAAVSRQAYDMVLLDVQMPDMDGWDTLASIRAKDGRIRVVMCTVKASLADVEHGWVLGCDGYVTKPFDVETILSEVEAVLDRSEEERRAVRDAALDATRKAMAG
jgi:DNA-binding response OmpR family regulator